MEVETAEIVETVEDLPGMTHTEGQVGVELLTPEINAISVEKKDTMRMTVRAEEAVVVVEGAVDQGKLLLLLVL